MQELSVYHGSSGRQTVGYAYLSAFNERYAYRYTADLSIYLAPDATGHGIGGMLLSEIERAAGRIGIRNIVSIVTEENAKSIAFHERHGFQRCGELCKVGEKFGRSLSVIYYQKALHSDSAEPSSK